MKYIQPDMFGVNHDVTGPRTAMTPQRKFGYKPGFKCSTCKFCIRRMDGRRTLYQCDVWNDLQRAAVNISKDDEACQRHVMGRAN